MSYRFALITLLVGGLVGLTASPAFAQERGKDALMDPSEANETAPDSFQAQLETTKGTVVIDVTRAWSPLGADRFYNLVKRGYYDEVRFFRVVEGFMVQFGISGDPDLNSVWSESNFQDDPVVESNRRGYVTFAKTGAPNSRSTQLFINFGNNGGLDSQGFSPIGQVSSGMDVVDSIYGGYGERPNQGLMQSQGNPYLIENFPDLDYIERATIVE